MKAVTFDHVASLYSQNFEYPKSSLAFINNANLLDRVRDENLKSLIARKKLHLVLDLDNTLLDSKETTKLTLHDQEHLKRPRVQVLFNEGKLREVKGWMIKLRPNVGAFLKEASTLFDLSIFTHGTRTYARQMLDILDPEGLYFTHSRVITIEDCPKTQPLKKGLDLMLSHERVVLVVDDRKVLWENNVNNLIQIKPYNFFDDTSLTTKSWSRWVGDESEKYGELARVLRELKKIHWEFYNLEEGPMKGQNLEIRDVRHAIDEVKRKFRWIGSIEHLRTYL